MTNPPPVRFTLKAANGVALSVIGGYETWRDVAPSQTDEGLKIILSEYRDDKRVQGRHSRRHHPDPTFSPPARSQAPLIVD